MTKFSQRRIGVAVARFAATTAVAAAAVLAAAPAYAAGYGPYHVTASPTLNERSGPGASYSLVGQLAHGATVYISCQTTGTAVNGSDIWDRLTNSDYVSDYWISTPVFDKYTPGIPHCGTTPPPKIKVGRTASGNEGTPGQCTYWAIKEFLAYSGYYPYLLNPANNGNAEYWATNAALDGWSVTATPTVHSIVVFPPGVNGAESVGHVAWVTGVSGNHITFTEMNGTAGPGKVDTRTVVPASSVRYILAP